MKAVPAGAHMASCRRIYQLLHDDEIGLAAMSINE